MSRRSPSKIAVLASSVLASSFVAPSVHPAAAAGVDAATETRVHGCLTAAAAAHRLPAAVLVILLKVEGGSLGRVSRNTNGTSDIGPLQVNTIWVPKIARRWGTTPEAAFLALRDNLCANFEGGAWILRRALDEARGDFWGGVAIYHSHTPERQRRYLRGVLDWTRRLQAQAQAQTRAAEDRADAPPPRPARPGAKG